MIDQRNDTLVSHIFRPIVMNDMKNNGNIVNDRISAILVKSSLPRKLVQIHLVQISLNGFLKLRINVLYLRVLLQVNRILLICIAWQNRVTRLSLRGAKYTSSGRQ